ncbi:hypothetical protein [Halocola ammonii]
MIDKYFKHPVWWDLCVSFVVLAVLMLCLKIDFIALPEKSRVLSVSGDIPPISFTAAGFIITLLAILITFKINTTASKKNYSESNSVFELFFVSDLYIETVKQFKKCIKSLIVVALSGYLLKLINSWKEVEVLFFYSVAGVIIISLTLWRCLLILNKILNLQGQE